MSEKKFLPTLNNQGGDTSKRWYVQYHDGQKWCKKYLSQKMNAAQRTDVATAFILSLPTSQDLTTTKIPPTNLAEVFSSAMEKATLNSRKKSKQTYASKIKIFLEWCNGKGHSTVHNTIVTEFRQYLMSERNLHGTTVDAYITTLHSVYNQVDAINNPFKAKKIRQQKIPAQYFQTAQAKRVGAHLLVHLPVVYDFTRVMCYCFLRPAEICNLVVGDVLLDSNQILVRAEIAKNKKQQYALIPAQVKAILEQYCKDKLPFEPVFIQPNGKKYAPKQIANRHQKALKELGFDTSKFKLYSWRHTGAVACVKAGRTLTELRILMRHASEVETAGYIRGLGLADLARDLISSFPDV